MADQPVEFGKRRPNPLPPEPGLKRSHHVALLLMGTLAVGGGAYAWLPREDCAPRSPGTAAPALPQSAAACDPHLGSAGGYGRAWHSSFFRAGTSGRASAASADAAKGDVSRGGFGSLARAFGFSGRG